MRVLLAALLSLLAVAIPAQGNVRAWHQDGQTFVLWQNEQGAPDLYDVHRLPGIDEELTDETLIATVSKSCGVNWRLLPLVPNARWRVPLPRGQHTLENDECLFVSTPPGPSFANYVVVPHGVRQARPHWRTGLVDEIGGPIQAHEQFRNAEVTVYAHWTDGLGRNALTTPAFHGQPHLFAVWGLDPERQNQPSVVALHDMEGSFRRPSESRAAYRPLSQGVMITPDDAVVVDRGVGRGRHVVGTRWLGHWADLPRFGHAFPEEGDEISLHTPRRVAWEIEWCLKNLPLDPDHLSLHGEGTGATGALMLAATSPEAFSTVTAILPPLAAPSEDEAAWLFGEAGTLSVPASEGMTFADLCQPNLLLQTFARSTLPTIHLVMGTGAEEWPEVPALLERLDAARLGLRFFWDERSPASDRGAHWRSREELTLGGNFEKERGRIRVSLSGTDLDPDTEGRQPHPAIDPWGTWGGNLRVNARSYRDREDEFQVQIWSAAEENIRGDVTVRGLSAFTPEPGTELRWLLWRRADRRTFDSGRTTVSPDGSITVPGMTLMTSRLRLLIDVVEEEDVPLQFIADPADPEEP